MAGVKITDLGTLTAPVSADLLYIVDVSDTSQSPQGTSKQIELGNIVSSGTWTPTFSDYDDAISASTLNSAIYSRVGNIVTCSMNLNIEVDFSAINVGSLNFTLPFSTSSSNPPCGSLSSSNITKQFNGAVRNSTTTQGLIVMGSEDISLVTASGSCHAIFQYEVL